MMGKKRSLAMIAECSDPFVLSGSEKLLTLNICKECKLDPKVILSSRMILNFQNVTGTPDTPNYHVYVVSESNGGDPYFIGPMSFYSVQPKLDEHTKGMDVKLQFNSEAKRLIERELKKSKVISLLIEPQDPFMKSSDIHIDSVHLYLLYEKS